MSLIDVTFFEYEPLYIPMSDDAGSGVSKLLDVKRKAQINNLITRKETEYLKYILGIDLYNAFMAGLEEDPIAEKWTDLASILCDSINKLSPIANYVYFFYLDPSKMTDVGLATSKVDNMELVNPITKQVEIWNEMVDMNTEIVNWLEAKSEIYEIDGIEYPIVNWSKDGSLLDYKNRFCL
jgi:hypothetical protein